MHKVTRGKPAYNPQTVMTICRGIYHGRKVFDPFEVEITNSGIDIGQSPTTPTTPTVYTCTIGRTMLVTTECMVSYYGCILVITARSCMLL